MRGYRRAVLLSGPVLSRDRIQDLPERDLHQRPPLCVHDLERIVQWAPSSCSEVVDHARNGLHRFEVGDFYALKLKPDVIALYPVVGAEVKEKVRHSCNRCTLLDVWASASP